MLDYAAAFTNKSGVFPDILAINASGPSATDGTEFVANMVNDSMWGVWQMLLNRAGMTPNGVLESDSASQIKEALWKTSIPPGVEVGWHQATDPATAGYRLLLLNGQGVLVANFSDLVAATYVGDANNAAVAAVGGGYYRADDAAGTIPNIAGIYLILPETRGYAPRGLDVAATVDPDGASRYLGDHQLDAFQGHLFYNGVGYTNANFWIYGGTASEVPGLAVDRINGDTTNPTEQGLTSSPKTDASGTPRTSSETVMNNSADVIAVGY